MTPFCFEHVFLAGAARDLFDAYFDAHHLHEQDRALEIAERHLVEQVDCGDEIRRTSRVVTRRQVPALVRPLWRGQLDYIEEAVGYRATNEIAIDIRLLGGRGRVIARYQLAQTAPGSILRRYAGHVSVDVALVGARIERGIVAEFERSLARSAACTQAHLARQTPRSVAARA
jgi:hypothetical protein